MPAYEYMPMISYLGNYLTFDSDLKGLVYNQFGSKENVYLRLSGFTTAISIEPSGKTANDHSRGNALAQNNSATSPNLVSFQSVATNVSGVDENGLEDVFTKGSPATSMTYTNSCFGDGSGTACPCGNTGMIGRGCENAVPPTGGAKITAFGMASVSTDTLVLQITHMPPVTQVQFCQGTAPVGPGGVGTPFGDGLVCVGGSLTRLAATAVGGMATYSVCNGSVPLHIQGMNMPGVTRYYQGWYHPVVTLCSPGNFNTTDVVKVVWGP